MLKPHTIRGEHSVPVWRLAAGVKRFLLQKWHRQGKSTKGVKIESLTREWQQTGGKFLNQIAFGACEVRSDPAAIQKDITFANP